MSGPDSVGGVVAHSRTFSGHSRFSGEGVVAEMFPLTTGRDQSNSLNSGTFLYISWPPQRNNINSLQNKSIYQKFGGAMAPVSPPTGYATVHYH